MNNKFASHGAALRAVDPARRLYLSEVVALLGSSSQLSRLKLQSHFALTDHREQIGVIVEMTVSTMTGSRASPAIFPEKSSGGSICGPHEAGSFIPIHP